MQVFSIGNLSRLEKVLESKKESAGQTEIPNAINRNPKRRVLGSPGGIGGDCQRLGSPEGLDDVVHVDVEFQLCSRRNCLFKVSIEFSKVWRGRHPHPHHKVLVCDVFQWADNVGIGLVQVLGGVCLGVVVGIAKAVFGTYRGFLARKSIKLTARGIALALRACCFVEAVWHFEFILEIRSPRNAVLSHDEWIAPGVDGSFRFYERKFVVEKSIRNQSARIDKNVSQLIDWVAICCFNGALATDSPRQLIVVSRGHVFVVVLVKVCQFVVDQDGGFHVLWDLKGECTVLVCVVVFANARARRCHALFVSRIVELFEFHDFIRFRYQMIS